MNSFAIPRYIVLSEVITFLLHTAAAIVFGWSTVTLPAHAGTQYSFSNFAGVPPGSVDGTVSASRFYKPYGVATDSGGNVYVADTNNHTIRKITPVGAVTTLAGAAGMSGQTDGTGSKARFNSPMGIATDSTGNVYVADTYNNTIRKITPVGAVTTLAGAAGQPGQTDGTGSIARFNSPLGIATDSAGNVYVADSINHTIRKITPAGVVSTFAGAASSSGSSDGSSLSARFFQPSGIATDSSDNVYVADTFNHMIRKITPSGVVTTVAGTAGQPGPNDGTRTVARFYYPRSMAVDSSGNVFVADEPSHTIRRITTDGQVTTLAGMYLHPGSNDGTSESSRFNRPWGLAADQNNNIYVADSENCVIRKIMPNLSVSTFAGTSTTGSIDGDGITARFFGPFGIATDSTGNVYVADTYNNTIRKITPVGTVTTLAGAAGMWGQTDGPGSIARFSYPFGVATDSTGNVYVADTYNNTIRKITPVGAVTTLAGAAGQSGSTDGSGNLARFNHPSGIATDSECNVYVADTQNHTIRKITPAGVVTTLAGASATSGFADGVGSSARFKYPNGILIDSAGNILVADSANHILRKVTQAGIVTKLAGAAGNSGQTDGIGSAARFYFPYSLATDKAGNILVADKSNHVIRKVTASGSATTLAGAPGKSGFTEGMGGRERFMEPTGITSDYEGNIFVSDQFNRIIKGSIVYGPVVTTANPLPSGTVNQTFLATLIADGGTKPYTWEIASGSLPPGIRLDETGVLVGTPTSPSSAHFTLRVVGHDGLSSTAYFDLEIRPSSPWIGRSPTPVYGMAASSGGNRVMVYYSNCILQSEDSGTTWNYVTDISGISGLWSDDAGNIFVRKAGELLRMSPGGNEWKVIGTTPGSMVETQFSSNLWCLGGDTLYRSQDNGQSWEIATTSLPSNSWDRQHVLVVDDNLIFVADYNRAIYRSSDGGLTFQSAGSDEGLPGSTPTFLLADQTSHSTIYCGTYWNGVYKSIDSGATWSPANNGLPKAPSGESSFDSGVYKLAQLQNGTLLALCTDQITTQGIYQSSDGGLNWASLQKNLNGHQILKIQDFAVTANDTIIVTIEGYGVFKTTPYAASWSSANTGWDSFCPQQSYTLTVDSKGTVYSCGTDPRSKGPFGDGLCFSSDGGNTWSAYAQTYRDLVVKNVAVDQQDVAYAASYWRKLMRSEDRGQSWTKLASLENGATTIAPDLMVVDEDDTLYLSGYWGYSNSVLRSTDRAGSWVTSSGAGISTTTRFQDLVAVGPGVLYCIELGTGPFQSLDGGESWQKAFSESDASLMSTITGAGKGGASTVYVWGGTKILRYDCGTNAWIDEIPNLPQQTEVSCIAGSPFGRTFVGTKDKGVYSRKFGTQLWQKVGDERLDSLSIYSMAIGVDNTLYVGTNWGVYSQRLPIETMPYGVWKQMKFQTPGALANVQISGEGADPDKDGIVNLLEYAFGLNPLRNNCTTNAKVPAQRQ